MGLYVYAVRWLKDTNPHYPGVREAMDIAETRVVCSSASSAAEYVRREKKECVEVISVEEQERVV